MKRRSGIWWALAGLMLAGPFVSADSLLAVDLAPPRLTLHATPAFSPNGDGSLDRAPLEIRLDEDAALRVLVRRRGRTVRRLAEGMRAQAGVTRLGWDGLVRRGKHWVRAPEGTYAIGIAAVDARGNAAEASGRVVLDTTRPEVRWRRTSPTIARAGRRVRVAFRLRDRTDVSLSLRIATSTGHRVRKLGRRVLGPGSRMVRVALRDDRGRPLPAGGYTVIAAARDASGNRATLRLGGIRVHRKGATQVYRRLPGAGRRVALTFDDCVNRSAWRRILNTLERKRVKATFFCNSIWIRRSPDLARRTVRAGHLVGSHTSDHTSLPTISSARAARKIRHDQRLWWRWGTTSAPWFRPPFGAYNRRVLRAAGRAGYTKMVLWDVDPKDWKDPGSRVIRRKVVRMARTGSIILLHVKPQTAGAIDRIIRGLRARRLEPVGLDELFRAAGIP